MKIAFIQCPSWADKSPNYSIALLGAILKKEGFEVKAFDLNFYLAKRFKGSKFERLWNLDYQGAAWYDQEFVKNFFMENNETIQAYVDLVLSFNPNVICFTVYSISFWSSKYLIDQIKKKNKEVLIVLGGPECLSFSRGTLLLEKTQADIIGIGEADFSLPNFLNQYKLTKKLEPIKGFIFKRGNSLVDGGPPEIPRSLDNLPFADFSIFNEKSLISNYLAIVTSRGCFNRCEFCWESRKLIPYRYRSAENIVAEIEYQIRHFPGVDFFWFNDSLINGNMDQLRKLCDLLIGKGLKIQWGGQTSLRREMDLPFLNKMKAAGATYLSFGVESGSPEVLRLMKKPHTRSIAERVIEDTHKAGINAVYNIILGFPGETEAHFEETKEFINRTLKFTHQIAFNLCSVLKGTALFENREELGIIDSPGLHWYLKDKSNTYQIRIRRLEEAQSLLSLKQENSSLAQIETNLSKD